MAIPLAPSKRTVDLAGTGPRVSRIRRNPPPPPRKESAIDREDREKISATLGVLAIAIALAAVIATIAITAGWTPRQYEIRYQMD